MMARSQGRWKAAPSATKANSGVRPREVEDKQQEHEGMEGGDDATDPDGAS